MRLVSSDVRGSKPVFFVNQLRRSAINLHGKVVIVENQERDGHNAARHDVAFVEDASGKRILKEGLNGNSDSFAMQPRGVTLGRSDGPGTGLISPDGERA